MAWKVSAEYAHAICAGVLPYDANIDTFRAKRKELAGERFFNEISAQVAERLTH